MPCSAEFSLRLPGYGRRYDHRDSREGAQPRRNHDQQIDPVVHVLPSRKRADIDAFRAIIHIMRGESDYLALSLFKQDGAG